MAENWMLMKAGRAGWLAWREAESGARLFVRCREDDGRLVIAGVLLEDDAEPLSSTRLRQIPLGRVEAALSGHVAEAVRAAMAKTSGDPLGDLRKQLADIPSAPVAEVSTTPLRRPPASGGGDEFYREVARQYLLRAALTNKPAAVLAEEAGVPVGTVHRWIREARRLGHLPAGRKGKVG